MSTDFDDPAVRIAVQAVRCGDRNAFATIVRLYQRRLFGLALIFWPVFFSLVGVTWLGIVTILLSVPLFMFAWRLYRSA